MTNVGKRWTVEEDDILIKLYKRGHNIEYIADIMERKPGGIAWRLEDKGVIESRLNARSSTEQPPNEPQKRIFRCDVEILEEIN